MFPPGRVSLVALKVAAVAIAVVALFSTAGATQPFEPALDNTFISNAGSGANADITFRTSLPAGHHILGQYVLEPPPNSWSITADSAVPDNYVTAVGTMQVNLDPDGDCAAGSPGTAQTYGPFFLRDQTTAGDPQAPVAKWMGTITDFADPSPSTRWTLRMTVDGDVASGFVIEAVMTDAILPSGTTVCTPQIFTVTFCGKAKPVPAAPVCGSPSDEFPVMTNPTAGAAYEWTGSFQDEFFLHFWSDPAQVCIGPSCPTPTASPSPTASASPTPAASPTASPTPTVPPGDSDGDGVPNAGDNCPSWPNPAQNLPPWTVGANDPDCDGFASTVESPAGTNALVQCGFNAWPADITNNQFADTADLAYITGNFGKSVPPAPARYNIAPEQPDTFIDTADIAKMTGFFGKSCAPCPGDLDCDAVTDGSDNCPNWPNPTQALPPWTIAPNDPDCDGFSSAVESYLGTLPLTHCGGDAWPADINNNNSSDTADLAFLTGNFGESAPPAPARYNIAPDPPNAFIDTADIAKMTGFFGKSCS